MLTSKNDVPSLETILAKVFRETLVSFNITESEQFLAMLSAYVIRNYPNDTAEKRWEQYDRILANAQRNELTLEDFSELLRVLGCSAVDFELNVEMYQGSAIKRIGRKMSMALNRIFK